MKVKKSKMTDQQLLERFEILLEESTKAVNGMSRRSEDRLSKEAEKVKSEILERMKDHK